MQKRALVIELIGLPDSGKTTLGNTLVPFFANLGITAVRLTQDAEESNLVKELQSYLKRMGSLNVGRRRRNIQSRKLFSVIFRAIFKALQLEILFGIGTELFFFEQGPYFTWIVEKLWARVPEEALRYDFKGVTEPDLVIFLAATPEQVRKRGGVSHMAMDEKALRRIYRVMKSVARKKNWVWIAATDPNVVAEIAQSEILDKYYAHNQRPKKQERFVF